LSEKYEKQYQNYLKGLEKEKKSGSPNVKLMDDTIYKTSKTIFKDQNNETFALIRR
jgi:hypothetical protein